VSDSSTSYALTSSGSRRIFTHSEIDDQVGIMLNRLHTDTSWSWSGTAVTSYSSTGYYAWHTEGGGGGWAPHNWSNVLDFGCLGCAYAAFHAHVEFSYQGVFDPTGLLFYNVMDNRPTVNGDGTWVCRMDLNARHYSGLWKAWIHTCGVE
jgi:hypothetical protein